MYVNNPDIEEKMIKITYNRSDGYQVAMPCSRYSIVNGDNGRLRF